MVKVIESAEYNDGKVTAATQVEMKVGFDAETSAALTDVEHTFDSKLEFLVAVERCFYDALTVLCKDRLHDKRERTSRDSYSREDREQETERVKHDFNEITEGVVQSDNFFNDEIEK
jgi:hypothetical protein